MISRCLDKNLIVGPEQARGREICAKMQINEQILVQ